MGCSGVWKCTTPVYSAPLGWMLLFIPLQKPKCGYTSAPNTPAHSLSSPLALSTARRKIMTFALWAGERRRFLSIRFHPNAIPMVLHLSVIIFGRTHKKAHLGAWNRAPRINQTCGVRCQVGSGISLTAIESNSSGNRRRIVPAWYPWLAIYILQHTASQADQRSPYTRYQFCPFYSEER